mgnify:CR=1 FL=1
MKIGILTLPLHTNYGGILQAYALQTVLKRMGHDVYVIENKRRSLSLPIHKMPFVYGKRIVKNLMGHKNPIFYEQKINREQPIIRQYTDVFIRKYIHLKQYDTFSDIQPSEYDAFVVGSDQVWRPRYFGINEIEDAYLKFAKSWDVKRLAYAVSFGTENWEYTLQQTEKCSILLKMFDAISLREDAGVKLCKKHFGLNTQQVLDPTMLLHKEDYIQLFKQSGTPPSKGNLLCYILDETPEKEQIVHRIAIEKGLNVFKTNSKVENRQAPLNERIQPPVEQWIRGFYDADFVITDSFHACVFSILFNKPFLVCSNIDRGISRFNSILNMFDLQNRMITNTHDYKQLDNIKWENINSILKNKREEAYRFLQILDSL